MLKNCYLAPVDYNKQLNARCGEIICQTEADFIIICSFCKLKHFEFDDFLLHFKNLHLEDLQRSTTLSRSKVKQEQASVAELDEVNGNDISENDNSNIDAGTDECITLRVIGGQQKQHMADDEEEQVQVQVQVEYIDDTLSIANEDDCKYDANNDTDTYWVDELQADIKTNSESEVEAEDELKIMKKKRNDKEYKCEYCNKSYAAVHRLKVHTKLKHLRNKDFKCELCQEKFVENNALEAHVRNVHIGYPCDLCDKIYKSRFTLREHKYIHKEVKDFKCDFENCDKAFVSRRRLTVHKHSHSADANYVCEICGFRTRLGDALKVHKRTHTGEKPYACAVCEKRFISASLLNEHKAMHSTERPHKCDICGATFSRAKALYHHKPLHSAVKEFICKICGNAYAQRAGLSGHMRQHKIEMEVFT